MKLKINKVVLVCVPILLSTQVANAVPLPGGTLDPTTIPKYVTPLVIPPVMNNSGIANDYDIAVRQFKQQILPGGIWNTVNGRTDGFPATTIWSYGPAADPVPDSGALGGAAGVAPAPNSQFNYPAYTFENKKDVPITVDWINDLVDINGNALPHLFAIDQSLHWANPVADCESGETRTDCAGNSAAPYTGPVPIVTHVHGTHVAADSDGYTEAWWLPDANNINCMPRNPNTGSFDVDYPAPTGFDGTNWNVACEGTIANKLTDRSGTVAVNTNNIPGVGSYKYQNDQPSTTLWYHDHSLGMTRLNVYAGPAGFWLIRDMQGSGQETGLSNGSILPAPAPVYGEDLVETNFPAEFDPVDNTIIINPRRHKYREIPIVIQDRSFNKDGSLFYPDNRAFFEGLNVAGTDKRKGQFPRGTGELRIDMDPATSDIAPIWNPEAFFNTMVVNGVTWPKLEVSPALYRFRLLNGSNSRFINLALTVTDENSNPTVNRTVFVTAADGISLQQKKIPTDELRFWQIGAEQSLMPRVVAVRTGFATESLKPIDGLFKKEIPASDPQQALLMGLAERADVIVDFRGLPDGTIITMTNTAPDAPFGGFPDVPADPGTTGQVMRFVVNHSLLGSSPSDELRDPPTNEITNRDTAATSPWKLVVNPGGNNDKGLEGFRVTNVNPIPRELALIEEESQLICVDVDIKGNVIQLDKYMPVAGACQEMDRKGVANGNVHPTALPFAPKAAVVGTVDAAGTATVTLWSDPIVTNVASGDAEQWNISNLTVDGHPIHIHLVKFKVLGRSALGGGPSVITTATGAQPWENGWKDTVVTFPGEVTSVVADFDINGLYVWHCHIVEHEDNEMMVPMCVGTPGVDCPSQLF